MNRDPINQTRYRALRAGLVMVGGSSFGGALIILTLPRPHAVEWLTFVVAGILAFALLPPARRARMRGDRRTLERLALFVIGATTVLILQRLAWSLYGSMVDDPGLSLFRPTYAFLPFLYLAAITVMSARKALRYCWLMWAGVLLLTLPALVLYAGLDAQRHGFVTLLVWLLLANPLFILMMHALPSYEEQLDKSQAEVAEMRERTELMGKLAESERRFNLVVEGMQVGVWDRWMLPEARHWWSPRFYELIGYTPEELPPNTERLKALMHPDDRERVWQDGTLQLQQGDIMDIEFRLNTKAHGYRWFNSHAKAERDHQGRMTRLTGAIADIHDRRLAEDQLRAVQAELTRLAYRDTLTDLYNRRYFDEHFHREWERARRNGQALALLLIDLDHFKAYNDRYGHPAGDACLVSVAQLLTRCATRPADIVARLGGEEFGVVLPDTDGAGAEEVGHRIRALLGTSGIAHAGAEAGRLTMSIGVAAIEDPHGPGPAELFEQADQALYEVKRRGRDGILRFSKSQVARPATQRQFG